MFFVERLLAFWLIGMFGSVAAAAVLLYSRSVVEVKGAQSLPHAFVKDFITTAYVMMIVFAVTFWVLLVAYVGWAIVLLV